MAEPADLTAAIATEVAKQLPVKEVYNDAVRPAAKQLGALGEDVLKTLQITVLLPFMVGGALHDRFRSFLDKAIRQVPEAGRIEPMPQIVGPVLEGIRYEPLDSPITEMFSQLLSASMDKLRVHDAHPAFPQIIRQLSPDEAVLLNSMWQMWKEDGRYYRQHFTQDYFKETNTFGNNQMELDELPRHLLMYPENIEFYGQHLYALGITAFFDSRNQEPIWHDSSDIADVEDYNKVQTGIRVFK